MAIPLTKLNKKSGALYTRPPGIQASIDEALSQDLATLTRRGRVTDSVAAEYLPSECIVHLVRRAIQQGDDRLPLMLVPVLLARCEANLKRTVPDKEFRNAEELREEIMSRFGLMFAESAIPGRENALDYYECRFNRAFRFLRIDRLREEFNVRKKLTSLPETIDDQGEFVLDDDALARLSTLARTGPSQEDSVFLHQVLKAVSALPEDERRAVVLCRILGFDEESDNPTKRTAATICKVEGRTIRNRLSRATKRLQPVKEIP